jgi:hypothetical protein
MSITRTECQPALTENKKYLVFVQPNYLKKLAVQKNNGLQVRERLLSTAGLIFTAKML